MSGLKFGVRLPAHNMLASRESLLETARLAESLEYDSIWVNDHLLIPRRMQPQWSTWENIYEPLITLAFLAHATERVELGESILLLPLRNPALFAKQTATLDILSEGRLIIAVGVGWIEEDYAAASLPFHERGRVLDEAIIVARKLWSEENPSFDGRYTRFPEVSFYPKPYKGRIPPIWVGGASDAALRRAARLGDGWHPSSLHPEAVREGIKKIKGYAHRIGRSLNEFTVALALDAKISANHHVREVSTLIEQYAEASVTHLVLRFSKFDTTDITELTDQMKRFASEIIPSWRNRTLPTP